jgi:hypothetical protein
VFDPAQAEDLIGDLPQLRAAFLHDDHLQAFVVIQVNMGRGQLPAALDLCQALAEVPAMLVINHG